MNQLTEAGSDLAEMLAFRQRLKDELGLEGYLTLILEYQAAILKNQVLMPLLDYISIADKILDVLDKNLALDDTQREVIKACYVVAAFELMGEDFINDLVKTN